MSGSPATLSPMSQRLSPIGASHFFGLSGTNRNGKGLPGAERVASLGKLGAKHSESNLLGPR